MNVQAHYGKSKTTTLSLQGSSADKELDLKFSANSPQNEKFKKFEINWNAKVNISVNSNTISRPRI